MSDALIVGIISAIVTLIGIIASSKATQDAMAKKLDKQQGIIETKMSYMEGEITEIKADVKSHNGYARLFSESIPAIKERLSGLDKRVENLENKI